MPSARPPAGQRSFVSAAVDAAIDRLTARFADVDLAQVRGVLGGVLKRGALKGYFRGT
jgi:hypothetical protein